MSLRHVSSVSIFLELSCSSCFVLNSRLLLFVLSVLSSEELGVLMTKYDLKRLEMYTNQLVDYHLIMDLLPPLARFYFLNHLGDMNLSAVQAVSIFCVPCVV